MGKYSNIDSTINQLKQEIERQEAALALSKARLSQLAGKGTKKAPKPDTKKVYKEE